MAVHRGAVGADPLAGRVVRVQPGHLGRAALRLVHGDQDLLGRLRVDAGHLGGDLAVEVAGGVHIHVCE